MNHFERTDTELVDHNSIPLLNVHVPGFDGNSNNSTGISIQLIPATPTDSQCSEGGSLLVTANRTESDYHQHHHQHPHSNDSHHQHHPHLHQQKQSIDHGQQKSLSSTSSSSSITMSKDPLTPLSNNQHNPYECDDSMRVDTSPSSRSARKYTGAPCNLDRVNIGEPDEMTIQGYVPSVAKKVMFYAGVVCTLGVLLLYAEWQPELKVKLTHSGCPLDEATLFLLKVSLPDVFSIF